VIIVLAVSFVDGGWYSHTPSIEKSQVTFKNTKAHTAYAVIYNLQAKSLLDFFTVEPNSSVRTYLDIGQPMFVLFTIGPQHPTPNTVSIDSFAPGPEGVIVQL
jgi:hypothetical protein